MSFNPSLTVSDRQAAKIARLENYHRDRGGILIFGLTAAFGAFVYWAATFTIDETAHAVGEVIASSRVQVIQAVDGGVLAQLNVKEGDRVEAGQVLGQLNQTRVGASVGETEARLFALRAKAARLRAEVSGAGAPMFPQTKHAVLREQIDVERQLFAQRRHGLNEDLRTLKVAVDLAKRELGLVETLARSGDASGTEVLRAQKAMNEAESRYVNRKNKFLEDARVDLAKAEDEISQNEQVFTRKNQEQIDSIFYAQVPGIVKNIRVTTVGGVLKAGEEVMQIVPVDDELVLEAKVLPSDIGKVQTGLNATIRFDPFDYTLYGAVPANVVYVSADTLKENKGKGEEVYYRVHVKPAASPVKTTTGKTLAILPGMTAQVDIRTGERTVLDYLLKPIRRTVSESFRER